MYVAILLEITIAGSYSNTIFYLRFGYEYISIDPSYQTKFNFVSHLTSIPASGCIYMGLLIDSSHSIPKSHLLAKLCTRPRAVLNSKK